LIYLDILRVNCTEARLKASPVVDALRYASRNSATQAERADILGLRSRASEVLSRRRPITVEMIQKINTSWKIPADQPYRIAKPKARPGRSPSAALPLRSSVAQALVRNALKRWNERICDAARLTSVEPTLLLSNIPYLFDCRSK
jgi:hypothetical protein